MQGRSTNRQKHTAEGLGTLEESLQSAMSQSQCTYALSGQGQKAPRPTPSPHGGAQFFALDIIDFTVSYISAQVAILSLIQKAQ